jgi:hypothetical protein
MDRSVTIHVLDQTTGERLTPADVMLYPIGVPGETRAESNEDGSFSFNELSQGEYSLAVYDPQYAPHHERFDLTPEDSKVLELHLTAGGFLSGDHRISKDGTFRSPPLRPARYFLRMAGILRKPAVTNPSEEPPSILERYFDFLYPNARNLADAVGFDIAAGEVISGLQVRIARPMLHRIRGKVIGDLPEQHARISVMFAREIGAIENMGGAGAAVQADGNFEYAALPGRYSL